MIENDFTFWGILLLIILDFGFGVFCGYILCFQHLEKEIKDGEEVLVKSNQNQTNS